MITLQKVAAYFEPKSSFLPFLAAAAPIVGAGISMLGAKKSNEAQVGLSREQMDFQERMSNTAYQRSTADMRKAGINPMLSYMKGGASSPQGAMPVMKNTMESFANSALNIAAQYQQVKNLQQQNAINLPEQQRAEVVSAAQASLINSAVNAKKKYDDAKVHKIPKYKQIEPTKLDNPFEGGLDFLMEKSMEFFNNSADNIRKRRGL